MGRLKIGLTMRETLDAKTGDVRDALSRDWSGFMAFAAPDADWVPIPNLGEGTVEFARRWSLGGFIFTGGDDPGLATLRDVSESALLKYALMEGFPVFGVCRGMQMIQINFGGALEECRGSSHIGVRHSVTIMENGEAESAIVNSYHRFCISEDKLAPGLIAFAKAEDVFVEGFVAERHPICGVMWHPERETTYSSGDSMRIRKLFGL